MDIHALRADLCVTHTPQEVADRMVLATCQEDAELVIGFTKAGRGFASQVQPQTRHQRAASSQLLCTKLSIWLNNE